MYIPIVVVSGGPSGGKSSFLARAEAWLMQANIHPLLITDTAAELVVAGVSEAKLGLELFQEKLLLRTIAREKECLNEARELGPKRTVILADGGALDGAACLGYEVFQRMIAKHGYTRIRLRHRYDLVFHLVSAATTEEARALDARMRIAWLGHRRHFIIDNSTDFEMKMHRALCTLARVLEVPGPPVPAISESAAWARALARA